MYSSSRRPSSAWTSFMQAAFSRDRDENSLAGPFGTLAAPTSAGQQVLAPLSRCNPSGLVMLVAAGDHARRLL
jgi:hypothetical protein